MNLSGKKILVTGADGFIGSHLVEFLVHKGYAVKAFVFYNSFGSWGWLDQLPSSIKNEIEIFLGDIRDPYGVKTACANCEIVFHLAALIGIPYSYHSPDTYIDTNIKGTLNILQAARELEMEKVIHTSTSEVYGTAQFVPISELHPLHGQSPYSATKIAADQLALSFYSSFNTPISIARPFNTYGPRQSTRAVIPTIITQIATGISKLKLGSLCPTRDFTHVKDTVKGFVSIAESDHTIGKVINIGSNFEISIENIARNIAKLMQKSIDFTTDEQRIRPEKSEVERLWADNTLIQQLTGWKPNYSGLEGLRRGLEETIAWFLEQENLKKYKSNLYNI